ncbi:tyrosine-type recombinase/integrase [Actinomyces lilanjuaniae]|nr:tyrosine-type recombinase/integrase [Actinomyces lilanjuaniae]
MTTWTEAIEAWTTAMRAAGRSPGTIRVYTNHMRRVQEAVPAGPAQATTADLRRVLAEGAWAPETRKSVRSAITSFYKWLADEGLTDKDPSTRLPSVSVPTAVARPTPEDVVTHALETADPRVRAMIMLGAYAGLRCAEIATVHSTNWDGQGLYVTGKGGRQRYVPVVRDDLRALLHQAQGWLFPGKVDGHISPGWVCKLVSRALPPGWTAHTLRHRCATKMFAGTRDLLSVGAVLGHARPETTQRYVRLPDDALRNAVTAAA